MKKLLALILCVMMFVSVMSTAAFADSNSTKYDTTDQRTWKGESQNQKIVEALRTNIENMYGSLAVDNAVFSSVKTIDGMLKDMIDGMLKDYSTSAFNGNAGVTSSGDLNDAILAGLRSTVGGEITKYLNEHYSEYYSYDSMGNRVFNPTKYAGVYAKAASSALTSGKAVAGIQAYMLYAAQRSAFNNIANQAHDLRNEIVSWDHWKDYGFGDMSTGIHGWNTPDVTVDGVLHNIDPYYDSMLSALGQLGVDLDGVNGFGLGFWGIVEDVDGNPRVSNGSEDETTETPLLKIWGKKDDDNDGNWERIRVGYEGNTYTTYFNGDDNKIFDPINNSTSDTFNLHTTYPETGDAVPFAEAYVK